jgi:hypothetical protein
VSESSFFPSSSPTFGGDGILDGRNINSTEVESWCGFDLHFLYGQEWRALFHVVFLATLTSSFEKVPYTSVSYFFFGSLILGDFSLLSSLYILVISPLIIASKDFLPLCG